MRHDRTLVQSGSARQCDRVLAGILLKMFGSSSGPKWSLSLFSLALLIALAAGCGGGDGDSSSQTSPADAANDVSESNAEPLSKAEFIKRASAICSATKQRSSVAFREYAEQNAVPSSGPGLATKAADLVETVFVPVYDKQIEEIGALGIPAGDEEEVGAMLTAMQRGVEDATQEPLAFIRQTAALNQASRLAVAYGLPACSNGNV
jgi:hypothetical protein